MEAYRIYWILHLLGLFLAFSALGGLAVHAIGGGGKDHPWRKPLAIGHGVGLFLALLGGFGLQARANVGWPGWLFVKIAVWIVLGALYAVALRRPGSARAVWWSLPVLALVALAMVVYRPF